MIYSNIGVNFNKISLHLLTHDVMNIITFTIRDLSVPQI